MTTAMIQKAIIQPTDRELLMRFVDERDEGAFRTLVERHARLVRAVCRRVLGRDHDVDDAFQATFLVLARHASSIRCPDSVAAWLFRVAHRTASRAAIRNTQRNEVPLEGEPRVSRESLAVLQDRETFEALSAELKRLPLRYRLPLVLFYLEGKSRRAAAEELDLSDAALKARLARGRRLLRRRLMRRGVALSIAFTSLSAAARAAGESALREQTVSAAMEYAATGKVAASCSATPVSLAQGVRLMTYTSFAKTAAVLGIVAVAGLLAAAGFASQNHDGRSPRESAAGASEKVESRLDLRRGKRSQSSLLLAQAETGDSGAPASKAGNANDAASSVSDTDAGIDPARFGIDLKQWSRKEEKINAALKSPTKVDFFETPLRDAMDFLSTVHDVTIILDEQALAEEQISTDEPITQILDGIPLESVLDIILSSLDLTYLIEDDVMKITTQKAEKARKETRVYFIQDLEAAGFDPEALVRIIGQISDAEGEPLPGYLVITQPQSGHRKTAELMKQLHWAAPTNN